MIEITPEESNKGVILDKDDKGGVFIKFLSEEAKNIIVNYDFNEDEIKTINESNEKYQRRRPRRLIKP